MNSQLSNRTGCHALATGLALRKALVCTGVAIVLSTPSLAQVKVMPMTAPSPELNNLLICAAATAACGEDAGIDNPGYNHPIPLSSRIDLFRQNQIGAFREYTLPDAIKHYGGDMRGVNFPGLQRIGLQAPQSKNSLSRTLRHEFAHYDNQPDPTSERGADGEHTQDAHIAHAEQSLDDAAYVCALSGAGCMGAGASLGDLKENYRAARKEYSKAFPDATDEELDDLVDMPSDETLVTYCGAVGGDDQSEDDDGNGDGDDGDDD